MKYTRLSKSAQTRIDQAQGKIAIVRRNGKAGWKVRTISPASLGAQRLADFEVELRRGWKIVERDTK